MADTNNPLGGLSPDGGTGEPWATDDTLDELIKQTKELIKQGKIDKKDQDILLKNIKKININSDEANSISEELLKSSKKANAEVAAANKNNKNGAKAAWEPYAKAAVNEAEQTASAFSMVKNSIKGIDRMAAGVVNGLMGFEGSLSTVTGGLINATLGATVGALAKYALKNIEMYQDFISIGQDFQGSIILMNDTAGRAGLTLAQLAKVTKAHSQLMASIGIKAVLDNANAVKNLTREFGYFGMGVEELQEFNATYLEGLRRSNTYRLYSDKELANRTANYMLQLAELSKLTGIQRDELNKNLSDLKKQDDYIATLRTLSPQMQEKFANSIDSISLILSALPPELATQFQSAALKYMDTGSLAFDEMSRSILALAPGAGDALQKLFEAMKNGTEQDILAAQSEFIKASKDFGGTAAKGMELQVAYSRDAGATMASQAINALSILTDASVDASNKLAPISGNFQKAAENSTIAIDDVSKKMLQAQQDVNEAIAHLQSKVNNELIGVVDTLINKFNELTANLSKEELYKSLDKAIETFGTGLNSLAKNIEWVIAALVGLQIASTAASLVGSFSLLSKGLSGFGSKLAGLTGILDGAGAGFLKSASKFVKGAGIVGAIAGVGLTAYDIYDANKQYNAGQITEKQRNTDIGSSVGGTGGALAGAAAGALVGSVVPIIGTAIGGLVGGIAGYFGGDALGGLIGEQFGDDTTVDGKILPPPSSDIQSNAIDSNQPDPIMTIFSQLLDQSKEQTSILTELRDTASINLTSLDNTMRNHNELQTLRLNTPPTTTVNNNDDITAAVVTTVPKTTDQLLLSKLLNVNEAQLKLTDALVQTNSAATEYLRRGTKSGFISGNKV